MELWKIYKQIKIEVEIDLTLSLLLLNITTRKCFFVVVLRCLCLKKEILKIVLNWLDVFLFVDLSEHLN